MSGAREHLDEFGMARYRVRDQRTDEFLALQRRAEAIYRGHALRWSLVRIRTAPEEWIEHGPEFREEADLDRAAEAFDAEPDILEGLGAFRLPEAEESGLLFFEANELETEIEVGDSRAAYGQGMPPIAPEEMTEAMRFAHALAAALGPRLKKILPPALSVRVSNEVIAITQDDGSASFYSLVDVEPEAAIEEILDRLQDDASEELAVPWPPDREGSVKMHTPQAEIRDGAIHGWYGPRNEPVLALDPIPLTELQA